MTDVIDTTVLTHITMPRELRDQVKVYAGDQGLQFAEAVVQLVTRALEEEGEG